MSERRSLPPLPAQQLDPRNAAGAQVGVRGDPRNTVGSGSTNPTDVGRALLNIPYRLYSGPGITATYAGTGVALMLDLTTVPVGDSVHAEDRWVPVWDESSLETRKLPMLGGGTTLPHIHPESDVINLVPDLALRLQDAPGSIAHDNLTYARKNGAWDAIAVETIEWDDIVGIPATFPPTLPIPQSGITDLENDLTAIENKNTVQDGRLDAVEAKDTSQDTAINGKMPSAPTGGPWAGQGTSWVAVPPSGMDQATADARYVNVSGDTMTGALQVPDGATATPSLNFTGSASSGLYWNGSAVCLTVTGTTKLTLAATASTFTTNVRAADGSNAACAFAFGSEISTGLWRKGTGSISLGTQSNEIMNWQTTSKRTTAYGPITLPADPTAALEAATKQYVDAKVSGAPGGATLSDTPPAGPVTGQLWVETDTGALFVRWADSDSSQWVQLNAFPSLDGYVKKTGDTITGRLDVNAISNAIVTTTTSAGAASIVGYASGGTVFGGLGYGAYGVYSNGQTYSSGIITGAAGFVSAASSTFGGFQAVNAASQTVSYSTDGTGNAWINSVNGGIYLALSGTAKMVLLPSGLQVSGLGGSGGYAIDARAPSGQATAGGVIGWGSTVTYYGIVGYHLAGTPYGFYGNAQGATTGGWVASDARLKIVDKSRRALEEAIPIVMAIPVRKFSWDKSLAIGRGIINGDDGFGWLAQEVETILPVAVHDLGIPPHDLELRAFFAGEEQPEEETPEAKALAEREDITMKSINEHYLLATLWQAVQELTARVQELEAANGV